MCCARSDEEHRTHLNVVGVGGARHMTVDLLVRRLVFRLELRLDVSRRFVIVLTAGVFGEADLKCDGVMCARTQ